MNNRQNHWSGITAPSGTALRRAQLIVDFHGGSNELARAIADALIDTAVESGRLHPYIAEDNIVLQDQRTFVASLQNKSGGAR